MKKIVVDSERCIGCGACVSIAEDVFDISDEGRSYVKNQDMSNETLVQTAIDSCPTSAISLEEVEEA